MSDEEYKCDCQNKWRRNVLSGCATATVIVFAVVVALVMTFGPKDGYSATVWWILRAVIPTIFDIVITVAAMYINHSSKVSITVRNYTSVIALVLVLTSGALLNDHIYLMLLFPCFAIFVTPPFADLRLLNVVFFCTVLTSTASCLIWASRVVETPVVIKISVVVGVETSCFVFYFFARSMFMAMMAQMKFVTDGWAEQERLIAELRLEPLTRLYNRAAFQEAISALMKDHRQNGTEVVLAFIDLDNFKGVNDTFGHAAGDAVLMAFSELMVRTLGTNRNVFRYGGDEFAMCFKNVPLDSVRLTMESIRSHYADMVFDFIEGDLKVSASIGIASYHTGMTSKEWVIAADNAAYDAKRAGKNNVVVAELAESA